MAEQIATRPGYETRDVRVRLVLGFASGLVVAGLAISIAIAWLYSFFEHQIPSPNPPSRIEFEMPVLAPPPRLQTDPHADLLRFETEQNAKLNSYGWVDRDHGVIRIPIERAMDLVAQRGSPTRGPGARNSSGKTPEQLQQEKAAATKP
jgi:hypothetical protein